MPYEHLDGDPEEWAQHAMAELRHYQRAFLPTQKLVILFHRQHFTANEHVSHWQALIVALKAQDKDGESGSDIRACSVFPLGICDGLIVANRSRRWGLSRAAV